MIDAHKRPCNFVKVPWCGDVQAAISQDFPCDAKMVRGALEGRREVFRVDGVSWLITEIIDQTLFIWFYQGRGALNLIKNLIDIARKNGLAKVSFFSKHEGFIRGMRVLNPTCVLTDDPAELQYIVSV